MSRLAVRTGVSELPEGAAARDEVLALADDAWQLGGGRPGVPG